MSVEDFPRRARAVHPFDSFTPKTWQGTEPPGYDWMVEGCMLRGTVGMISGDGGTGKSLIMQQLLTAAGSGLDWLGIPTQSCKTYGLFCEDDKDELHRRQASINRHYGLEHDGLGNVRYAARVGMENVLMDFERRTDKPLPTPLFDQLRHDIRAHGAQLVVLDTLADVFAGNEIIRNQVRRFVSALRSLAMEIQGTIVLTAHPSLTGLTSGSGISGSTAWNNSVRSRMYLTRPKTDAMDEGDDTNERVLKTMKNNQGPAGGQVKLLWERGVFVVADSARAMGGKVDEIDMDNRVLMALGKLTQEGTKVSPDRFSNRAFARVIQAHPICRAFSRGEIEASKERLINSGRAVIVTTGPSPSRQFNYIVPKDMAPR